MPLDPDAHRRATLEINARSFRPDPAMDRVCDLWENDRAAFDALPAGAKHGFDVYLDLRQAYRDAKEAGVYLPNEDPNNPFSTRYAH